jgi:hypothetical protein
MSHPFGQCVTGTSNRRLVLCRSAVWYRAFDEFHDENGMVSVMGWYREFDSFRNMMLQIVPFIAIGVIPFRFNGDFYRH